MISDEETCFITPITKSTRLHSLWHTLTRVRHGISTAIASVYVRAQARVTEQQVGDSIRGAIQKSITRLRTTPWQALALRYRPLLLGLGVLLLLLIIWKVPQWQAARWEGRIEPKEVAKQESDTRTTVVQAIGGAVLLIGLYFTAKTLRTTQEGQITDRFTRAINQLGEMGSDKLAIRLGGIYALERIARDSKRDHGPVMEVLTAYVREHAPWPPKDVQPLADDLSPAEKLLAEKDQLKPKTAADPAIATIANYTIFHRKSPWPKPAADIQAILTVLGRCIGVAGQEADQYLDLSHTDLRGAHLVEAHLKGVSLEEAHLEGACLAGARLEGTVLTLTHLEGADLTYAHLQGVHFYGVHLEGAKLLHAHLEEAGNGLVYLQGAHLAGAHLEGARLHHAHLEGAKLWGAHLEGADLEAADVPCILPLLPRRLGIPLPRAVA